MKLAPAGVGDVCISVTCFPHPYVDVSECIIGQLKAM